MGYYTSYKISIKDDAGKYIDTDDVKDDISSISGYHPFVESCTWYNNERDMIKLSKLSRYKDVVFCLSGEGEDADDLWKKYFKNGKVQVCKGVISYPEYSADKLK